jgi:glycosyltransferase involved in cell wall biosynthesis
MIGIKKNRKLGLLPDLRNALGGPAIFQKRIEEGFRKSGIKLTYGTITLVDKIDILLLINAIRNTGLLYRLKKRGVTIVQRLGSPFPSNGHLPIGLVERARTWLGIQNVAFIRAHLADQIIYQSHFVKKCWEDEFGEVGKPCNIIYNGVDLRKFSPEGSKYTSSAEVCIISVEGTQEDPNDSPAFLLAQSLIRRGYDVKLLVFGKPWGNMAARWLSHSFVSLMGIVPNTELPHYYRAASFFVSNDIIAAGCPNSVIEALACGTPVIGYKVGVLPEILTREAGSCVPTIGNPWKGESIGNVESLANAALQIVKKNSAFRKGARKLAEDRYNLEHIVEKYLQVLFE